MALGRNNKTYYTYTMQDAAGATADGTEVDVAGSEAICIQLSGTFSATVTFEATVDNTNWIAVQATDLNAGTAATTATAAGLYRIDTKGLSQVRARISAYTSGSVTAKCLFM